MKNLESKGSEILIVKRNSKKQFFGQSWLTISAAALALGFAACSPKNARLYSPPETLTQKEVQAGDTRTYSYNPRVDILFVVDNSFSMDKHQSNLAANIDKFVNKFTEKKQLDFHIGVVSVSDMSRYREYPSAKSENYIKDTEAFTEFAKKNNSQNPEYYKKDTRYSYFADQDNTQPVLRPGTLRPVYKLIGEETDKTGRVVAKREKVNLNRNFISSEDANAAELLKGTIRIGALSQAEGSPINEESFSAAQAALLGERTQDTNKDFLRQDALLVVIFVTDAEDSSELKGDTLFNNLVALKENNAERVLFYGALIPETDSFEKNAKCIRDGDDFDKNKKIKTRGPVPLMLQSAITQAQGSYFSMCSDPNFGEKLASIGQAITEKTGTLSIFIQEGIDLERTTVTFGKTAIPSGAKAKSTTEPYWVYEAGKKRITILNLDKSNEAKGAKITVKFAVLNKKFVK